MAEKNKKVKKETARDAEKGKESKNVFPEGKYFYAVGKRKEAVAQVRLYPTEKTEEPVIINGRELNDYFGLSRLQNIIKAPLLNTGQDGKFQVFVKVSGGGINGQAEAARLGISRAIVKFNEVFKKPLKDLGFLTRDARAVERKKPGLKKARRRPQWAKR